MGLIALSVLASHSIYPYSLSSYKFQTEVGKYENQTTTLSDADTVWTQVRHMHMGQAIEKLRNDFNQFLQEHAGFKGG